MSGQQAIPPVISRGLSSYDLRNRKGFILRNGNSVSLDAFLKTWNNICKARNRCTVDFGMVGSFKKAEGHKIKIRISVIVAATTLVFGSVSSAAAETGIVNCGMGHLLRPNNEEVTTTLFFHNPQLNSAMTIQRITIRNAFGEIIHESGPEVGMPHPRNTDFTSIPGGLDITTVPAQMRYWLNSIHFFGSPPLPADKGANEGGFAMTAEIKYSARGRVAGMTFTQHLRARDATTGSDFTRDSTPCVRVR